MINSIKSILLFFTIITLLFVYNIKNSNFTSPSLANNSRNVVNVGVSIFSLDDPYMSEVR